MTTIIGLCSRCCEDTYTLDEFNICEGCNIEEDKNVEGDFD